MTLFSDLFSLLTLHALLLTLKYALAALFCSGVLSLLFVFMRKKVIFSLCQVLWVLPGFAYALITLNGMRALGVQSRYSMMSVMVAWIIAGTPYLTLALENAIRDLDFRQKEAMQSLGASPLRAFFYFEILYTLPAQAYAFLQQFWLYLTSFSLVMILSGGYPNETLEVGIYTSVRLDRVNYTHAIALGIWQMLLLIPLRFGLRKFPVSIQGSEWNQIELPKKSKFAQTLALAFVFVLGAIFWAKFRDLEVDGLLQSLATSLILAVSVSIFSILFSLGFFYSRVGFLAETGAWISPMLLTLFWWRLFSFRVVPWVNALCIQLILFAPWVARVLYPMLRRRRARELEAAQSLGCSPFQAWLSVEWPRVRGSVFFAFALVVALSCTEVTAVLLFSDSDFLPLSVWVQNSFLHFRMDEATLGTLVLVAVSYLGLKLGRESV